MNNILNDGLVRESRGVVSRYNLFVLRSSADFSSRTDRKRFHSQYIESPVFHLPAVSKILLVSWSAHLTRRQRNRDCRSPLWRKTATSQIDR